MVLMQSMFKAYAKASKKAGKSKKRKEQDYDSSDSSDSEEETGFGNTGLSVDKCLIIDEPINLVHQSTKPHLIEVASIAPSNNDRADKIAIESAQPNKVTEFVAVMRIFVK